MNEFQIIKKYFQPLTNSSKAAENLENDTATIEIKKNHQLIVSKDLMVEDVHFLKSDGAYNIAAKLISSNISDLAASGATPLYYMLGFSKNKEIDEKFIAQFCRGLKDAQKKYGLCLIGGDSVFSGKKLFFSITVFGEAKKNNHLKRNAALKGEEIFVSGFIGDAYLGLQIIQNKIKCSDKKAAQYLIERHLNPTARIKLGEYLVKNKISKAAIDVSDGLLADLRHICESSKLGAIIHHDQIPISKAALACLKENPQISSLDLFSGGDDYELIFTTNPKTDAKKITKATEINITKIGFLEKSSPGKIKVLDRNSKKIEITKYGYEH